MQNKVALVVGGTSGIGLSVAKSLAERAIFTYSIGRRDMSEKHLATIYNKHIRFIKADISKKEDFSLIKNAIGNNHLDYIILSAATETPLKRFEAIHEDEYDYAFAVNLKSHFFLLQSLIPQLNNAARLLFISSRLATSPEAGSIVYAMTKAAMETLSAGLNKEFSARFLSASISPGVVDTEMQTRLRNADNALFPHTKYYQDLQPNLRNSEIVGAEIVSYLCDTTDNAFLNNTKAKT